VGVRAVLRSCRALEKRNGDAIGTLDPDRLDVDALMELFDRYGDERVRDSLGALRAYFGRPAARPEQLDEFAAAGLRSVQDLRDRFVPNFYFGCEADDRLLAWAFAENVNPAGARFRPIFGSDISHWDVPDMTSPSRRRSSSSTTGDRRARVRGAHVPEPGAAARRDEPVVLRGHGGRAAGEGYARCMTAVEVYVDPSCPWAYITSLWLVEVRPQRNLALTWRSFCLEIRDDYGVAPTMPEERREAAIAAHAVSHRMLRIMEAARASVGRRPSSRCSWRGAAVLPARFGARRLDPRRVPRRVRPRRRPARRRGRGEVGRADRRVDGDRLRVRRAQDADTTIVMRDDPPHGFKGPVMAPAPTGEAAVRLWDAIQVLSREPGFFEFTRPRANVPRPPVEAPDPLELASHNRPTSGCATQVRQVRSSRRWPDSSSSRSSSSSSERRTRTMRQAVAAVMVAVRVPDP